MREGSNLINEFILHYDTPNIRRQLGDEVAIVLGKALLYYVFTPDDAADVPKGIQEQVQNAYNQVRVLPVGENPVNKIPLIIMGHEGKVYMDEIPDYERNNNNDGNGGNGGTVAAGNDNAGEGNGRVGAFAGVLNTLDYLKT